MRFLRICLCLGLVSCWNQDVENPIIPGYPCGTRQHACSVEPLSCCWNGFDCGAEGTSCPEDRCCYSGDDYGKLGSKTEQTHPDLPPTR